MNGGAGYAQSPMQAKPVAEGHAPTAQTLVQILQGHRAQLLTQLRDIEQSIEVLEATSNFEPMFNKLSKLLQRSY